MTDARFSDSVRFWVNKLSLVQELTVLAGVVLFFVGLALPAGAWRIVALLMSGSALAYATLSVWRTVQEEHRSRQSESVPAEFDESRERGDSRLEPSSPLRMSSSIFPSGRRMTFDEALDARASTTPFDFKISDFCDLDDQVFTRDSGPKSEFSYVVKRALHVIKQMSFAHTVAFFWINGEKNQLVLENYVTDSDQFTSHRRRELANDLISQVATTGTPRIVTDLNQMGQAEMLGYYQNVEPVRSFAAIPVFFPKSQADTTSPVAVLTLDSRAEDAFGPETMLMLGDFTKLISALIKSYTGKYDLLVESEILRSVTRMHDQMRLEFTVHNITRSLAEEVSRLVPWDYVAVVLFHESNKTWFVQYVMNRMNDPYVAVGQQIDPSHSMAGRVIQSGVPMIVENLAGEGQPRFFKAERVDSSGSAVIVPLNSVSRCYGALLVESKDAKTYSDSDVKVAEKLVRTAVSGLEIFNLTEVVNNYVLVDETTGVATRRYFVERLHEEVQRAKDFGTDMTLVMISVDSIQEQLDRLGKEGFDFVLQNVGRMVKSFVRHYDLVGRFDFNRFAVLLVNTRANEGYLWAEKLRRNIASNIINIEQKSFSVTISVGVCGGVQEASDMDLMDNANKVLSRAIEAGGNVVRVF